VFADSRDSDLADSLRANVSRFAAYKADYVKTTIENILNDASIPTKDKQAYIDANMNAFSQYQATEETTATSRSRTAKQWKEFNDPQRLRLFPNLRWLRTRSVIPREVHLKFHDHVWSKDDDFWKTNTPGTEWNCKCDVEETDDPVTDKSEIEEYIKKIKVPPALEGNPAETGKVFTDDASYIKKARKDAVKETVSKCYYKDISSDMQISVMADRSELADNIHTGRILAKTESVTIRPHFEQEPGHPIKNPEYVIDGEIADAKRVLSAEGVHAGFRTAIKQGAKVVIIDFGNGEYKKQQNGKEDKIHYNIKETAKAISNRLSDFKNGIITKCYVVYKGKYIKIEKDLFDTYPNNNKTDRIKRIDWLVDNLKLLKT